MQLFLSEFYISTISRQARRQGQAALFRVAQVLAHARHVAESSKRISQKAWVWKYFYVYPNPKITIQIG